MRHHILSRVVGVGIGLFLGLSVGLDQPSVSYASQCVPAPPIKYTAKFDIDLPNDLQDVKLGVSNDDLGVLNNTRKLLYLVPNRIPENKETILLTETIKIDKKQEIWDGQFWATHQYPLKLNSFVSNFGLIYNHSYCPEIGYNLLGEDLIPETKNYSIRLIYNNTLIMIPVSVSFQLNPTFQAEMDTYNAEREQSRQKRDNMMLGIYIIMGGFVLIGGFFVILILKGIGRLIGLFLD